MPECYVLFNCRRCSEQQRLCRPCYRGQVFCRPCAGVVRRENCREYEQIYRSSLPGKLGNARRQAEYRARRRAAAARAEVVTHHGSLPEAPARQEPAPLAAAPTSSATELASPPHGTRTSSEAALAAQPEVKTNALVVLPPELEELGRCSHCGRTLAAHARRPGRRRSRRPRVVRRR